MLKSHESGLIRAADLFYRARWIEDPRGTRKSFCHDPRNLKIPVRRWKHHSLDIIPRSVLYRSRYDGCVRAICLTEGLAKTLSRYYDASDSSSGYHIGVNRWERIDLLFCFLSAIHIAHIISLILYYFSIFSALSLILFLLYLILYHFSLALILYYFFM